MGITEACTHLHSAPSTSTQLHSAPSTSTNSFQPPPSSTQLISASTELSATPSTLSLQINFWANLSRKSQRCLFSLKICTNVISRMLILIATLVFWICNPKSIFEPIRTEKVKVVRFAWKLAHMVSRGCEFLFRN